MSDVNRAVAQTGQTGDPATGDPVAGDPASGDLVAGDPASGKSARASVVVIGAGPAGLMSAGIIAAAGHRVTIYEHKASPARKLLMAGRGGLNLTHSEELERFASRYGAGRGWLAPALHEFPPQALRDWADDLGQQTFIGSSGRVFPKAMKASPLLRAWLKQLGARGVVLQTRHRWTGWDERGNLNFQVASSPSSADPKEVAAAYGETSTVEMPDALLLALGGASWPRLGSDGAWSDILRARGVQLTPLAPSNCAARVAWSRYFIDKFQGAPLKNIVLGCKGQSQAGELMITAQGLEGGAIYALSGALRDALAQDGQAEIVIDFCPAIDLLTLEVRLSRPRGKNSLANHLRKRAGLSALGAALLRESAGSEMPQSNREMAALIKACPIVVTGLAGLERAISSAGGISRSAVDDNFMLKAKPGTFVAGEMLDWDAPTGGYLLQATLSTAVAAANGLNVWLGYRPHGRSGPPAGRR